MPSLRKRVSSYFRQLSFHNEPRDKKNINENSFVTKYLQGQIRLKDGPTIVYGKEPSDLPNYELGPYETGSDSIMGCYSGPKGGLTTVKRIEKHLTIIDNDIDFIDTLDMVEEPSQLSPHQQQPPPSKSNVCEKSATLNKKKEGNYLDNTTMIIKVAGQEYCVTNKTKTRHSKSHSLGSISDFNIEIEKTKIDKDFYNNRNLNNNNNNNNNNSNKIINNNKEKNNSNLGDVDDGDVNKQGCNNREIKNNNEDIQKNEHIHKKNYNLSKSKSDGNPFQQRKRGKIIKLQTTETSAEWVEGETNNDRRWSQNDDNLPLMWCKKSDYLYGISDSLYDKNQVTKRKNGDPIADCFGAITRKNSAILAVADGVNWGEKASIAAKSAIHGCLHYLNKTIFLDTKPFDELTIKNDDIQSIGTAPLSGHVTNTKDVFICLLRAFNCAHDLILENNGMLTTLTVAIILPLQDDNDYICCVCNVGDTLAYVYSQKCGIRELTKGSHDINCNRDMRDALGALGPVDGINPELSNLTLSITKLQRGDIVMIASDGLTDNFDPNVCRFTVINNMEMKKPSSTSSPSSGSSGVPVKPPRRNTPPKSSRNSSSDETKGGKASHHHHHPHHPHQIAETRTSSLRRQTVQRKLSTTTTLPATAPTTAIKPLRSKTQIDLRSNRKATPSIARNSDGIPYVTPLQRYELQLLLIEDVLKNGISGSDLPTTTAKKLCENLVNFAFSITAAKRRTLEDHDLYFDNRNGVLIEVSQHEKKLRRKKGLEKVQNLPGKLDHVTVVAWNVGNFSV